MVQTQLKLRWHSNLAPVIKVITWVIIYYVKAQVIRSQERHIRKTYNGATCMIFWHAYLAGRQFEVFLIWSCVSTSTAVINLFKCKFRWGSLGWVTQMVVPYGNCQKMERSIIFKNICNKIKGQVLFTCFNYWIWVFDCQFVVLLRIASTKIHPLENCYGWSSPQSST